MEGFKLLSNLTASAPVTVILCFQDGAPRSRGERQSKSHRELELWEELGPLFFVFFPAHNITYTEITSFSMFLFYV